MIYPSPIWTLPSEPEMFLQITIKAPISVSQWSHAPWEMIINSSCHIFSGFDQLPCVIFNTPEERLETNFTASFTTTPTGALSPALTLATKGRSWAIAWSFLAQIQPPQILPLFL